MASDDNNSNNNNNNNKSHSYVPKLTSEYIHNDLDKLIRNEIPGVGSINMLLDRSGNLLDITMDSDHVLMPHANTSREPITNYTYTNENKTINDTTIKKYKRRIFPTINQASKEEILNEKQILYNIYNSTNGSQWIERKCWYNQSESDTRRGVTKDKSGFVIEIDFTRNNLKGLFPDILAELKYLMILILDKNFLTGELPAHIFLNFTNLEVFSIKNNQITDEIPWMTLPNSTNLKELWLDHNNICGRLDKSDGYLDELSFITQLSINNNQLTGFIPESIKCLENLEILSLSSNQLTGFIPKGLHMLMKLQYLFLNGNLLSGEIPDWIGDFPDIIDINLQNNRFTGFVPSSLLEYKSHFNNNSK